MKYLILTSLVFAITGVLVGVLISYQFIPSVAKSQSIPLPGSFLNSKIPTDLYANAEGIVVTKNEDSITIKNNSDSLVLSVKLNGLTSFHEKTPQGFKDIQFQDIQVGDLVKGGVSITLIPTPTRKSGEIIAHSINITHKQ